MQAYDNAISAFNEVIKVHPNHSETLASLAQAWNNKGLAFNSQNKYDEADAAFAEASYNKGIALGSLGKYDKAIDAYDNVLKLDPRFSEAWIGKGNPLKALGCNTEAYAAIAKANELGYKG